MRWLIVIFTVILTAVGAVAQQAEGQAPLHTSGPVVELTGVITRVQAAKGRGMPFIEVEAEGETTRIHLGSMRYLLQHNFNPSAGDKVEVKGFRGGSSELIAKTVKLLDQDKTLNIRDDNGRPLWQRGRYGRPQGRGRL